MPTLYQDSLVELTDTVLTLKHYYYPRGGSKTILLADIEEVVEKKPTLFNGKGRLWGTGNFRVWYARDFQRFRREVIYTVRIKRKFVRAGFSVENPAMFSSLLASKVLLRQATNMG
jgi:hypothetical protein